MDGDHTSTFRKAFHGLLRLVCFDVLLGGCIAQPQPADSDGSANKLQALLSSLQRQAQTSTPLVNLLDELSTA